MKIAYLILAHNTPSHLQRLVKSLSTDNATFYIHIDKKSDDCEYLHIKSDNVHFSKERIAVYWGHFSQVEAILILLKTAFLSKEKYDRFVLLSGSDYPIKSTDYIEDFFVNNREKEYISIDEQPRLVRRLTNYKLSPQGGKMVYTIRRILQTLCLLPKKRDYKKALQGITPYGGASWWALTYEAVDYILRFIGENPKVLHFFKHTRCPDEIFFNTLLGNSHFKRKAVGNLTYTDWRFGGKSPAYINEKHLNIFRSSSFHLLPRYNPFGSEDFLFARKFPDDSTKLVAVLDEEVRNIL